MGYACALAGRQEEARGVIAQLREMSRVRYVSAYHLALVHTALGEADEALTRLSEAADEREPWLCWIRTETALDPLRSDPRFLSLFERVLMQEWGPARARAQVAEAVAALPHAGGPDSQAGQATMPLPAGEDEVGGHVESEAGERAESQAAGNGHAPRATQELVADEVAEARAASEVKDADEAQHVSTRRGPARRAAHATETRRPSRRSASRRRLSMLHRAGLVAMGALLATLAAVAALIYFAPGDSINSVAVLPFANVNSDPDTEYISDGVAEHLINQLSQLPSLRVMARTTAFTYKGREIDPRTAGREMGVGAVMVGRVTKRGDVLLIQTELVRVADGARLWGGSYMRKVSELPAVQRDIAGELLQSLQLRLSGAEEEQLARRRTQDAEAYQLYLQGEYHRNRATPDDMRRSVEFFERSAARDPSNALTHVGLALAYRSLPAYGVMLPQEAYPRSKAAAQRALALDPQLASAHVPLASIKFVYDWKFAEAEAEYREALQLNPNHAEAHFAYANFLTAMERYGEAMEEYAVAERLDPFSVNIADGVVWSLFVAERYEEALARCRRNLERDPRHAQTYLHFGEIYTAQGRYAEAVAALQKARELSNQALVEIALGHVYAVSGRREEALAIARDYEARVRAGRASPFLLAVIYAGLDDRDAAFQWLEKSYEERSNWMALLKVGRRLAPLHSDPRFRSLVERVGFPNSVKS